MGEVLSSGCFAKRTEVDIADVVRRTVESLRYSSLAEELRDRQFVRYPR
jgi:hypothetical protein